MHIKLKYKTGQSTVEYLLLVTAVIAAVIAFVATKQGGFQGQINSTLNAVTEQIGNMGDRLVNSQAAEGKLGDGTPPYSVKVCGGAGQPAC